MGSTVDLRKLSGAEILRLRRQVVRMKLKGRSGAEIESATGVRQNRVSEIWRRYLEGGEAGLKRGAPGRKAGQKTLLSESADREIRRTLMENTPDLLHMPYSLWTRQIASDFIRRDYGVRLSLRCMTNYFKKWGFVCVSPLKSAAGRADAGFARFMSETYAGILRRAAMENIGIYWYGETWVDREYPRGRAPGGERVKMAQVKTARGTARFMFFEDSMTQDRFILLVSRLIRYADRKVFLIAADGKPCRGRKVAAWLKGREDRIEIFYHPNL